MSNAGNIVLALTDDDLGIEGQVDVDHTDKEIDEEISESDTDAAVAAIPREHRVSIVGRVEAERLAAQDLADAVEKSMQDRRDVYNSLFADDEAESTGMPDAATIVLALTDDDLGIEGQVEVDHTDKEIDEEISESDTDAAVAAIPREHRVSIVGRVEAERFAAQALAEAVEKSKQDRRDVYNSLFADDDATSTDMDKAAKTDGKVADQRTDDKRKENLETAESAEQLSPLHGRSTSSKGTPITVFPIRAKPCKTDAVESQWCKKGGKQKGVASAEKPLPERLYCCSHEITEVRSQDLAKSGKDKQNQGVASKKQEPSPRIRCPKKKSAKPLLPMTIMRLL